MAISPERLVSCAPMPGPSPPAAVRPGAAPAFAPPKAAAPAATPPAAAAIPLPLPPPGAPAAQPQQTEAQFGMEHKAYQTEPSRVRSKVAARFEGLSPTSKNR